MGERRPVFSVWRRLRFGLDPKAAALKHKRRRKPIWTTHQLSLVGSTGSGSSLAKEKRGSGICTLDHLTDEDISLMVFDGNSNLPVE